MSVWQRVALNLVVDLLCQVVFRAGNRNRLSLTFPPLVLSSSFLLGSSYALAVFDQSLGPEHAKIRVSCGTLILE